MIRRPPRSTPLYSSAASDVYKRQLCDCTLVYYMNTYTGMSYPGHLKYTEAIQVTNKKTHSFQTRRNRRLVVVVAGLSAVLWWTVWVGSVLLDIRRAKTQNRTSPCQKFLSTWSHVCLRCLCEKRGVARVFTPPVVAKNTHLCLSFSSTTGGVKTHPVLR